ncbi:GntR family transcriptional regulator [Dechloromonas denitrificans]|jgi:DNA-binding GntR family transcriptional regulator|uniref:GntR family transcriptional regulator n=1 Tax=Azonexaceae TaxID=2008795 RepID=UPI001CF84472|nr:FCD domain-containing protein [Dechloromonas denitrificans]UCV02752.1 FCD domain-containing protein [Dechloromonas denitrificans]UCV07065.1 FCD domain-containing protein [Dechloromonas denitrificans]
MQKNTVTANGQAAEPKTLVESAYQALRRDIIECRLRPGTKLRVEHLKNDYGVGAGTLREALSLLISDALVVSQGQRGFRVAPVSLDDFADITRTRVMLECEALRQSIAAGDDAWEGELMVAFHRLSKAEERLGEAAGEAEWEERNRVFHEVLIAACPSRWIKHFLSILYQQAGRYRHLSLAFNPIPRNVHAEHEALFEAVMAREAERAAAIMAEHIELTYRSIQALPEELLHGTPATAPRAA